MSVILLQVRRTTGNLQNGNLRLCEGFAGSVIARQTLVIGSLWCWEEGKQCKLVGKKHVSERGLTKYRQGRRKLWQINDHLFTLVPASVYTVKFLLLEELAL